MSATYRLADPLSAEPLGVGTVASANNRKSVSLVQAPSSQEAAAGVRALGPLLTLARATNRRRRLTRCSNRQNLCVRYFRIMERVTRLGSQLSACGPCCSHRSSIKRPLRVFVSRLNPAERICDQNAPGRYCSLCGPQVFDGFGSSNHWRTLVAIFRLTCRSSFDLSALVGKDSHLLLTGSLFRYLKFKRTLFARD